MRYGTVLSLHHDLYDVIEHWSAILPDLEVHTEVKHSEATGGTPGSALLISFRLGDQLMSVMHGLPDQITPAVSVEVRTDTQEESDRIYDALLEGGQEMACGWVTDKFGVSWQVSPAELIELVSDPDEARAGAANLEMQKQRRIDIAPIRAAADAAAKAPSNAAADAKTGAASA